jgi:glycogen synthase
MLLLSTQAAQRPSEDIQRMESQYNWPVAHRELWPDMSGGEAELYTKIQAFNARSRNVKIVFINQFGFNRTSCGQIMPEDMQFIDICRGSDVEFGMSIYEPFGISQLESLTFGGICVISSVCGCAGFVKDIAMPEHINNIIIADYTNLNGHNFNNLEKLLKVNGKIRGQVEQRVSEQVANLILSRLTEDAAELEERIETGFSLARNMSWETVVRNYLLPGLENKCPEKTPHKIFTKS